MTVYDESKFFQSLLILYKNGNYKECLIEINNLHYDSLSARLMNIKGMCYFALSELDKAEVSIRSAIEADSAYAQAYSNLGIVRNKRGDLHGAIKCFNQAISINKNDSDCYFNLGSVYKKLGNFKDAISAFKIARKINPENPFILINLGNTLKEISRFEESIELYKEAIFLDSRSDIAYFNLGLIHSTIGNTSDAIENFEKALRINSSNTEAYRNLSLVKRFSKNDPIIKEMLSLEKEKNLNDENKSQLYFALAKAFEDLGDYDRSFEYYQNGNSIKSKIYKYSPMQDNDLFKEVKKLDFILNNKNIDSENQNFFKPLFIVGMPRSGTSLIEQIICSHSLVYGAGELEHIDKLYRKIFHKNQSPSEDDLLSLRNGYFDKVSDLISKEKFFSDKMPHNFRYLGIIKKSFPEAKIIHVLRDSNAVCWSNYKHYFTNRGLAYSFDLKHIVNYYNSYQELMHFWKNKFGESILEIDYELLTENPENEIRKIINYLELDWEESCLQPHKNKRHVITASNQQVKKSIYSGSSNYWKRFAPYLEEYFRDLSS